MARATAKPATAATTTIGGHGDDDGQDDEGRPRDEGGRGDQDGRKQSKAKSAPSKPILLVEQEPVVGNGLTLSFTVYNVGTGRATGVHLDGALPPGTTWKVLDPSCARQGAWVRCDLGNLTAGGTRTVHVIAPHGDLQPATTVAQVWTTPVAA